MALDQGPLRGSPKRKDKANQMQNLQKVGGIAALGHTSRGKALLNGLLAWFIGFALYMLPAFIVAFRLAFEMGPQKQGAAAISAQISQTIAILYAGSWFLQAGLIVMVSLLVVWRAWAVATRSEQRQLINGLMVGAAPALLTPVLLMWGGFGWVDLVAMLVCLVAGVTGGRLAKARRTSRNAEFIPQPDTCAFDANATE
ncbi:MAG: hypothetical protein K1X65_21550 [Caldilineales bacterium]|nr:hypothetical protein [Caldilineales bacterium]MCW5859570.1 hypothetical protein [Caldilineales bacterium]